MYATAGAWFAFPYYDQEEATISAPCPKRCEKTTSAPR